MSLCTIFLLVKHAENDTENSDPGQNIRNDNITEKLFNMMEKIVERLANLENKSNQLKSK